jgi:hypothetical protein
MTDEEAFGYFSGIITHRTDHYRFLIGTDADKR